MKLRNALRENDCELWLVVGMAMAAYLVLGISNGADVGWDMQNYHYYNGTKFLHGGYDRTLFPAQIQSWFNPVLDACLVFLMENLPPKGVAFVLTLIQSFNIPLVFLLVKRTLSPALQDMPPLQRSLSLGAVLIAAISAPMTISETGTSFGDSLLSVLMLGSLLSLSHLFVAPQSVNARKWIVLAGLLAGLACGFKLTNLIYAPGLALMLLFIPQKPKTIIGHVLVFGVAGMTGCVITGGFWAWHLWVATGNPLFPAMNAYFHSPLLSPVNRAIDDRFTAKSLSDFLLYPFRTAMGDHPGAEVSFADPRFAVALMLSPALLFRRPRGLPAALMLFFAVSLSLWLVAFGIERYIVLLEMVSSVLIAYLLCSFASKSLQPILMITISVLTVALTSYPDWRNHIAWESIGKNGNWFNVTVPAELKQPNTLFILLGDEPTSYVIPSLPRDAVFVRLGGNFKLSPQDKLYQMRAELIAGYQGSVFTISLTPQNPHEIAVLNSYGWQRDHAACSRITSNVGIVWACPLQRITAP